MLFLKNNISFFLWPLVVLVSCNEVDKKGVPEKKSNTTSDGVSLIVLGTVQDAGSPHIACKKDCCLDLFENPDSRRNVVSLGLVDSEKQKTFLFEATPIITEQLKLLKNTATWDASDMPNGIFLTHAHIGHYTGLMYLGKEATNAQNVPVYAMPKMKSFLEQNGPWSQLISNKNIDLMPISNGKELQLTSSVKIIPFTVPHRDEYSETVGYKIVGPKKSVLFIPDIDKWERWNENIIEAIAEVDFAFLDATFYDSREIDNRDISVIPHPFVIESMDLFNNLPASEKKKIHFIHFNHTNPLLIEDSPQSQEVLKRGFRISRTGMLFKL